MEILEIMATPTGNNTSQNTNFGTGTTSGNTGTNQTPDKESKYEADLNGGTARVNSATTLADVSIHRINFPGQVEPERSVSVVPRLP